MEHTTPNNLLHWPAGAPFTDATSPPPRITNANENSIRRRARRQGFRLKKSLGRYWLLTSGFTVKRLVGGQRGVVLEVIDTYLDAQARAEAKPKPR